MRFDSEKIISEYNASLQSWIKIAQHQAASSAYLFPKLLPYLEAGKDDAVLELGAGIGHLVKLAIKANYKAMGSDYADVFVAYMKEQGIPCRKINALTVGAEDTVWKAIFTQGLPVLITKDMATVEQAYLSVYKALLPSGRFLFIFPRGDKSRYSRLIEHKPIYHKVGFKEVAFFRQQAFPSKFYEYTIFKWLEDILGKLIGIRDIVVLEKAA